VLKSLFFFMLLFLFINHAFTQNKLIVENKDLNEKYEIEDSDYIKILYSGYLNQIAEQKSHLKKIGDTTLLFNTTKSRDMIDDDINVRIEDIKGVKKLWKYELIARPVITLGTTLGSYFYFGSGDYSADEQYLYASLVGLGTSLLLNFIFDDTIEDKVSGGWTISLTGK
jgi:hypothetical protein